MSPQMVFTDDILDWLVALVNTDLGASMSLIICQKGDLYYYPIKEDVSDDLPMVLIKCENLTNEIEANTTNYVETYFIRIIYVATVTTTANVIEDTNAKAKLIAEKIADNPSMSTFTHAAKLYSPLVFTGIDYEPPENRELNFINKEIKAVAITCSVTLYARRGG